jgi:hypothetical protein
VQGLDLIVLLKQTPIITGSVLLLRDGQLVARLAPRKLHAHEGTLVRTLLDPNTAPMIFFEYSQLQLHIAEDQHVVYIKNNNPNTVNCTVEQHTGGGPALRESKISQELCNGLIPSS